MAKVRIKDIAAAAGVSVGTVDRVIHQRGKVAKAVQKKVEEAIKLLNYQPNLAARSLARKSNHKIAVILPLQQEDEFWVSQSKGILRALQNTKNFGFTGDIIIFNDRKEGELFKLKDTIFESGYEALLIAPTLKKDAIKLLDMCDNQSLPYVQINSYIERQSDQSLGYVGQDSFSSGQLAAKLLDVATCGEATVAVLHMESDVDNSSHMIDKEAGFRSYILDHTSFHVTVEKITDIENRQTLKESLTALLNKEPSVKGLFVTTSRVHYIIDLINDLGRQDITVVGFDAIQKNIEALKKYKRLFLINQNPSLQGYYAVMRLFDHFLKNQTIADKKYLPLDIITLENVSNYLHMQDRDNVSIDSSVYA